MHASDWLGPQPSPPERSCLDRPLIQDSDAGWTCPHCSYHAVSFRILRIHLSCVHHQRARSRQNDLRFNRELHSSILTLWSGLKLHINAGQCPRLRLDTPQTSAAPDCPQSFSEQASSHVSHDSPELVATSDRLAASTMPSSRAATVILAAKPASDLEVASAPTEGSSPSKDTCSGLQQSSPETDIPL